MFQPYRGENPVDNPHQYVRRGVIQEVYTTPSDAEHYITLRVSWLDRAGGVDSKLSRTAKIDLVYQHISRGWGMQYCPSVGDIIVCGFRQGGYPELLGFRSFNYAGKVEKHDAFGYYFRNIIEGEYSCKSKQGAEWYLDRKGSFHIIVRDQAATDKISNPLTKQEEEVVTDSPLFEIVVGQLYDPTFQNEVTSSAGNSLRLSAIDKKTGTKIVIDSAGNLEVTGKADVTLALDEGHKFAVVGGTAEVVGAESLALKSDVDNLREYVVGHTHLYSPGPSPSIPTPAPTAPAPTVQGTTKLKGS